MTTDSVRKTVSRVNPLKAAGADQIPGYAITAWDGQLASVLADIFNISLAQAVIPTCSESTTIVPVPNNDVPSERLPPRSAHIYHHEVLLRGWSRSTLSPARSSHLTLYSLLTTPTTPLKRLQHLPCIQGQKSQDRRLMSACYSLTLPQ